MHKWLPNLVAKFWLPNLVLYQTGYAWFHAVTIPTLGQSISSSPSLIRSGRFCDASKVYAQLMTDDVTFVTSSLIGWVHTGASPHNSCRCPPNRDQDISNHHVNFFFYETIILVHGSYDHYNDVIIGAITSQITSFTIVYSTVYSGADQRKHQSSVSLAFVRGIHRWPVNSPHKWPVTRKMFSFDDINMMKR